jgi:hypothetical protein
MYRIILFLSLSTIVSGCTWVSLTSAGEGVRLMGAVNVGNCQRIGGTTARTLNEVARVDRSGEKLQGELITLARNEAATMGGNAIIPESVIQNGAQSFGVFSCPR